MKKVLFVITRLAAGGAPAVMLTMLAALRNSGYDVELVAGLAGKGERDLLPEIQGRGVKTTVVPQLVRDLSPWNDIIALQKLRRLMKDHQYDVVHTHTTKAGILGRLAAKMSGVPHIIHSPHGHIFHGYINPVLTKLYIILERIAAGWSHKIVTLTQIEINEYLALKIGKPELFRCIHNGIDVEKFAGNGADVKTLREQMGIPRSAFVLTTVGRLVPIKGHIFLLKAMASAIASRDRHNGRELRCLIIGDGSLLEALKRKAEAMGISRHVIFLGYQEDVASYLKISNAFILPSLSEGFGLVIAEAMAAGLPVIAARVDGVPEIVIDGRTGMLVPPADAAALRDGILTLLREDERHLKKVGEENQKRAREEFSLEKMSAEIHRLYEEVLGTQ